MIWVHTEEFQCFGRVTIYVALCIIGPSWVRKYLRKPSLMRLMHFVMLGCIGHMVVGQSRHGQGYSRECVYN
jgi:hypothetical protein